VHTGGLGGDVGGREDEMALISTERDRHEKRKEEFQVKMHLINSRETQSIAEERE